MGLFMDLYFHEMFPLDVLHLGQWNARAMGEQQTSGNPINEVSIAMNCYYWKYLYLRKCDK